MTFEYPIPLPAACGFDSKGEDALLRRLALMHELQASLAQSRQAVVALNLPAMDQGTREQWRLSRKLQAEIQGQAHLPERTQELVRSEYGVMQALRLQAALLAKAQRKLQVLRNTLAGSATNYGFVLERSAGATPASAGKREEWI